MWGKKMFGNYCHRLNDVFNGGAAAPGGVDEETVPSCGHVFAIIFFGDFRQLPPIKDTPLYTALPTDREPSASETYGARAFHQLDRVYMLTEPVRQDANSSLIGPLTNMRNGTVTEEDTRFWNDRNVIHMSPAEKENFNMTNPRALILCTHNKDASDVNRRYIQTLRNVCAVSAQCNGSCAKRQKGNLGPLEAIPMHAQYAFKTAVKLTANLCPEIGLANGSRGTVRDIVYYAPGGEIGGGYRRAGTDFPVIIVEFPQYIGKPFMQLDDCPDVVKREFVELGIDATKLVPIAALERPCDCPRKCNRTGLPLQVAKAATVHSVQGMSIGANEQMNYMTLHIGKTGAKHAETQWPGCTYVGVSRGKRTENVAFNAGFTEADAAKVGAAPSFKVQTDYVDGLRDSAERRYEQGGGAPAGPRRFKEAIEWFTTHIIEQYSDGGSLCANGEAAQVLECMQQWSDEMASLGVERLQRGSGVAAPPAPEQPSAPDDAQQTLDQWLSGGGPANTLRPEQLPSALGRGSSDDGASDEADDENEEDRNFIDDAEVDGTAVQGAMQSITAALGGSGQDPMPETADGSEDDDVECTGDTDGDDSHDGELSSDDGFVCDEDEEDADDDEEDDDSRSQEERDEDSALLAPWIVKLGSYGENVTRFLGGRQPDEMVKAPTSPTTKHVLSGGQQ